MELRDHVGDVLRDDLVDTPSSEDSDCTAEGRALLHLRTLRDVKTRRAKAFSRRRERRPLRPLNREQLQVRDAHCGKLAADPSGAFVCLTLRLELAGVEWLRPAASEPVANPPPRLAGSRAGLLNPDARHGTEPEARTRSPVCSRPRSRRHDAIAAIGVPLDELEIVAHAHQRARVARQLHFWK